MKFSGLTLTWFDLLLAGLLMFGILRGRKRGMSEELLDVFQWLTIIVLGAMLYDPLGRFFTSSGAMGLFYGYLIAYALIALVIKLIFSSVKRAVGEKLVHADTFGNFEYYLGMFAGALRYFCVLLFFMSFLHAKLISQAERAATAKMQAENFGSISFPTIGSLQQTVFHDSWSGKLIAKHLDQQLIRPVPTGGGGRPRDTIGRRRQRSVEEVME